MALKDRYHAVEVGKFAVLEEVEFQTDYIQSLQDEIAKEFGKSQQFKQVLLPGQEPAGATTSTLRLSGTVTYFDPGNRCPVIRLIRSFKSCGIADRHLSGINELGD